MAILNALDERTPEGTVAALVTSRPRPRAPAASPLRVLLAEDNVVNRRLAIRLLDKHGHQVSVAGNGKEVLSALAGQTFDVVLMDVQMPEMTGLEATALNRQTEEASGRHTPIIAMTAHAMKGDRERCLASGMDGYISKPIRSDELFHVLDTLDTLHTPPATA